MEAEGRGGPERRPVRFWVEDVLLLLGALGLLAVAVLRWHDRLPERTGETILYVDLSVMAALCVIRLARFVRAYAVGERPDARPGPPRRGDRSGSA